MQNKSKLVNLKYQNSNAEAHEKRMTEFQCFLTTSSHTTLKFIKPAISRQQLWLTQQKFTSWIIGSLSDIPWYPVSSRTEEWMDEKRTIGGSGQRTFGFSQFSWL